MHQFRRRPAPSWQIDSTLSRIGWIIASSAQIPVAKPNCDLIYGIWILATSPLRCRRRMGVFRLERALEHVSRFPIFAHDC